MTDIIKKKRGRKPKNLLAAKVDTTEQLSPVNSEDDTIICHLPITVDDISNDTLSIFIKEEVKLETKKDKKVDIKSESEKLVLVEETETISYNKNCNKIVTHSLKFNENTKCWWCRNIFNSPAIQLPEDYYNDTFYCIGNFCSFNCVKSYNLDLNDSLTWERESLINLFYSLTYKDNKNITPAPHWIALEEYGGTLSIEQFRKNSIINTTEYLVLHPPLISRQMQIEESYKLAKLKEVPIDKVNKIYSEIDSDYTIKRTKPIQSSTLNLETTMGLVKKKK